MPGERSLRVKVAVMLAGLMFAAGPLACGGVAPPVAASVAPPPQKAPRQLVAASVPGPRPPCPEGMALVEGFCIDRWEASLIDVEGYGERPHSPYEPVRRGHRVRAVSRPGVVPQAHVSRYDAAAACAASGKRLCRGKEWVRACKGEEGRTYPYGDERQAGVCNDAARVSPVFALYPRLRERAFTFGPMNDPRLNQLPGTVATTGSHEDCRTDGGVYDMVGNLHEWVDEAESAFRGGYYLDTYRNGDGCEYRTRAHNASYRDYSTGFRCCADLEF